MTIIFERPLFGAFANTLTIEQDGTAIGNMIR